MTLLTALLLADPDDGHMMWDHGNAGWMWLWGALMMLVFVAVVLGGVWLVMRGPRRPQPDGDDRARQILGERYARGEISTDEYRERLDALR